MIHLALSLGEKQLFLPTIMLNNNSKLNIMRKFTLLFFVACSAFSVSISNAQDEKKETIAIYPFTSARGYWDYALEVGNAVEAGVLRSNRFTVVERNRFASISEEERFKEVNTSDIVEQASKFGATTIVTGHVVGVSQGDLVDSQGKLTGNEYVEISLSFKILDVQTSQIMKSELLRGRGEGGTKAAALQKAYQVIDRLGRAQIGDYLPQQFDFMDVVETDTRKEVEYLKRFKVWGGSADGLRAEDVIEVQLITKVTNPRSGQVIEEKQLLGQAKIDEVNGESTSTCTLINHRKTGEKILGLIKTNPESIRFEYKGVWHERRSIWDMLP